MGWSAEWASRPNGLVTLSFWASQNSLDDDEIKIKKKEPRVDLRTAGKNAIIDLITGMAL